MTVKTSERIFSAVILIFTVVAVLSFLYEPFEPLIRWACYMVILAALAKVLTNRRLAAATREPRDSD